MATIKQKLAYKEVVKGSTISGAMVKVGYSKETAKRTNKLTRSKGWQELIEKYISEEALMKVHSEGLKSVFTDKFNSDAPDYGTRHKYLETGYKVRGKLKEPDEKPKGDTYNIFIAEQRDRIARRVLARNTGSERPSYRLPDSGEPEV